MVSVKSRSKISRHGESPAFFESKQQSAKEMKVTQDFTKTVGGRIRSAREQANMTQQDIAKIMGLSRSAVAQWETGVTSPSVQRTYDIAKLIGTTPQWIAFGISDKARIEYVERPGSAKVPEIVFGSKPTDIQETNAWTLPVDYLKSELHCQSTDNLLIWRVEGSDMAPAYEYGDKIIVDTNAKRPSPSGIFLTWDGVGPALRSISVVPVHGKPTARVGTADGREAYEIAVEKLNIIGRARVVLKNL
jgi:transcriptional regulator with XRE-family HTH domain